MSLAIALLTLAACTAAIDPAPPAGATASGPPTELAAAAAPRSDPARLPPATRVRLDSAEVYYLAAQYDDVLRVLRRPKPARPREQLLLGWSHYRLGRMAESEAAFAGGLAMAPDHADLVNGHAFALYRLNRLPEAEAEFRRLLATSPEREESVRGLAGVLYVSQRFDECSPIYDRLLRQYPADKDAEHHVVKSVDGMLSAWRQAGRTPAEMVAEAWRLAALGHRRSAFEIFRWVLAVDAFHPGARLGLGTLGLEFGHEVEARRCLEGLLRENPDDAKARAGLARLHLNAGRHDEAERQLEQLLARHPKDAQGLALQKELESRMGKSK
jgi:tetratricopeptide (TPR) repeat protein